MIGIDAGDNLAENEEIKKAIYEAKRLGIIILPKNIEKRSFSVKKSILTIPISHEMKDIIDNRIEKMNEKKILSFLSHPNSLYYYNSYQKSNISCTKVDAVNMIIEAIPKDEKVIIFSSFIDVLTSHEQQLKEKGCHFLIITGKDRDNELKRKLAQFNDNSNFKILLTTIFKSADGLNLDIANHVIMLEFWWNHQRLFQAMGRIDRISQEKHIFIFYVIMIMAV